jgi:hypothetical protein
MARTRIISANKALYASTTGLTTTFHGGVLAHGPSGLKPNQLHRIDTLSFDVDLSAARTDVLEFGQLARIASLRTSDIAPTVSLGYFLTNGENEMHLGFNISGLTNAQAVDAQFISGILSENIKKRTRNIYVQVAPEGEDAFNAAASTHSNNNEQDVITFGSCALSNYSIDISVGEIPRADVELVAGNVSFITGHNSGETAFFLDNPSLSLDATAAADTGTWALPIPDTGNTDVDVLKPGDVTVTFGAAAAGLEIGGVDLSDICIQSITVDVPLSRTPIECLGSQFADSQSLDFPIDITMGVSALVKDFKSGSLQQVLLNAVDGQKQDITVAIKNRSNSAKTALAYVIKNAILDSQNFAIGIDDNETVDLQFSAQIAGATNTDAGLFCSGDYIWSSTGRGATPDNPEFFNLA